MALCPENRTAHAHGLFRLLICTPVHVRALEMAVCESMDNGLDAHMYVRMYVLFCACVWIDGHMYAFSFVRLYVSNNNMNVRVCTWMDG